VKVPNKDIAVKIVRVDDPKIPVAWKEYSMKRELKILKRVKHPNVINVYDVIKTRSRIYIFMDMAAASVASHLEATSQPASEQTARNWFGGISNAIAYLHHIEIAHRDLKNDNILIDSNGQAKLTDFGFSCFTFDRQKRVPLLANTSCGTKAYVAPEVFNPPYDAKAADVWSLGVCLYDCVTLLQPFRDDLPAPIYIKRQLEKGLVIPQMFVSKLDPSLQDLLKKMIEPDLNKRLRSQAIMVHPWMRLGLH
jgi:serine/threonine protein kinase